MLPPVLVLTAGLGTRLEPLSTLRAKPAMPVAGQPLVSRILRGLARAGVRDALLNLHHRAESVTAIVGDGRSHGLRVRYSWEQPLLGSGGGPRRAFSLVESDGLLVVNGDTLTDVDLASVWSAHRTSGAEVTMAVVENPAPDRYGGVAIDDAGRVTGFTPRGAGGASWHFVGVQCVERSAVEGARDGEPCESVSGLYRQLIRDRPGSIRAWRTQARFEDIGTMADYLATSLARAAQEGSSTVEAGAVVEPGARVVRSVVWAGGRVETGAEVNQCIVTDRVVVPRAARYHRVALVPADAVRARPGDRHDGELLVTPIDGGGARA